MATDTKDTIERLKEYHQRHSTNEREWEGGRRAM